MAFISILFISLLVFIHPTSTSDLIQQACKATRYQKLCESSLAPHPNRNATEIIQSTLKIAYKDSSTGRVMAYSIIWKSEGMLNRRAPASDCGRYLQNSYYRLKSTIDALSRGEIKNGRAWTSAALTDQHECVSGLQLYVNEMKLINETVSFLNTLIGYTSNALSMMMAYDVFGDKTASWKAPKTEREGFWEGGGVSGGKLGIPPWLAYSDVSVCKNDTTCTFRTVQEAVNAAPDWSNGWRFVIWVEAGVYKETVLIEIQKRHLLIRGEGMGKTVISGSLNVGHPSQPTHNVSTFTVLADGFMAIGLTIENTAGPDAHQAVAFRSDSDRSYIEECEFLGNQNTLYARSHRQVYNSCRIVGTIDFIFGNSASIFQNCTILVRPRKLKPEEVENNVVTAHGRIDPAQPTGFVFQNCTINGTEEYMKLYNSKPKVRKNFLGRPWKEFARTVFIGCNLESLITPQGWIPWKDDFALKTLYYGEINNIGKGSELSGRVNWSSRIPADHVNVYSLRSFLQSDQWPKPPKF
ncbi:hypothetical protein L1987_37234 [Smallanthus sonchifolius]|uniref:Uncharacterized protein n=1 Tax=Smallanthus sonchifolius TaxID=185202 RepID=A0ACB9HFS0_9ASTR|nr:hypothetical protein L1987_37234 [Smallanthus sonchifolius]